MDAQVKIDPILFERITADNSGQHSAVVYTGDFGVCKRLLSGYGVRVIKEFPFISAFGVYLNMQSLSEIAALSQVKYVVNQSVATAQMDIARKILNVDDGRMGGASGEGVTLAVIDTGLYPHLDFMFPGRLLAFVDFIGGKDLPYDDNGHGTFVAGAACGSGLKSCGKYRGIAPWANLVALRAMNKKGEGGAFAILEAMQWVYYNAERYNIRVVCMSFGSNPSGANDPLIEGAEALWKKGIVVTAAAGNNGPDSGTIKSPGASSLVLTVGAMDDGRGAKNNSGGKNNDGITASVLSAADTAPVYPAEAAVGMLFNIESFRGAAEAACGTAALEHVESSSDSGDGAAEGYRVAEFSSRGPVGNLVKPDIIAPAVNIISTSNDDGHYYSRMSGTSVATPMAAGLACLLLEQRPELTPDQVKSVLMRSARSISRDFNAQGRGLVQG